MTVQTEQIAKTSSKETEFSKKFSTFREIRRESASHEGGWHSAAKGCLPEQGG